MANLRGLILRPPISGRPPLLRGSQRRWARVHDVRFLATHPVPDRILEKYKDKLERKAKDEGLRDAEELRVAYREKIARLRRESKAAEVKAANAQAQASSSPFSYPPGPPEAPADPPEPQSPPYVQSPPAPPGIKALSSYIDVPKTLGLPAREIEYIWRLRHASSPTSLCAVMPTSTYERIASTARKHPQFILPLPRPGESTGAEIHFLQWAFPSPDTATVLFTHLAEYKLRGEHSTPHTTVTHHLDLAGPKGLVLLQGSVVEGRGVAVEDARWLLMCLQKFYGVGAEPAEEKGPRRRLLEQFSSGDGQFRVEELLEEAEKLE
ncbi:MAG: hypothetical protein M1832_005669 [Thelocarpon impressellum]|nr:MAG: hypothetical protein M1832_005669 [Thelocarpon impressellum]